MPCDNHVEGKGIALCGDGDSDMHIQQWDVCCVCWKNWKEELRRRVRCRLSEGGFRRGHSWETLEISSRKLEIPKTFHAKMGSIKDTNGMDLTEAEDIKKG